MNTADKVVDRVRARELADQARCDERRLVLANGCFDLLHAGHVRYLQGARACGDLLVVGINSDRSVRALKGDGRPLMDQQARARMVAALSAVDWVIVFDDPDVTALLRELRPAGPRQGHRLHLRDRARAGDDARSGRRGRHRRRRQAPLDP